MVENVERILQAKKHVRGAGVGAGRNASTDNQRDFLPTVDSKSLSPKISEGCQLINLNLSTSVGPTNMLGASTLAPGGGDTSPLIKWAYDVHTRHKFGFWKAQAE